MNSLILRYVFAMLLKTWPYFVCIGIGCFITYYVQSNKIEIIKDNYQKELLIIENKRLSLENESQEIIIKLQTNLKEIENESHIKIIELQDQNNIVLNDLATSKRKLYVTTRKVPKNAASKTSTSSDGETCTRELDPENAQRIIKITNEADKYKSQLESLQKWVNELTKGK